MRLYVGNLSFNADEARVEEIFSTIGPVESVHLIRDQMTGRSRGFGFVEMPDEAQAREACSSLDQQEFDGRRLTVNEAKPQERRSGGGGGGGYSRGGGRQRGEARW
ncbi:MAG: RNA recognition motif domain-containing protein [Vicinamibacterales bacterium]